MKKKKQYICSDYERNYSHSHCWNQTTPACGISLKKHKQCCLCDTKFDLKKH